MNEPSEFRVFPSNRSDSDPHVRDCIRSYTADYTVSNRNYEKYSSQHVVGPWSGNREGTPRINQRQEYEVDVVETGSQSDRVSTFLCTLKRYARLVNIS